MMFENEDDRKWHLSCIRGVFEDSGCLLPILFTELDGKRVAVPLEMESVDKKNDIVNVIKSGILSGKMKEICFASESWVTTFPPDTDLKSPDLSKGERKEGIIVNFSNAKEEHLYMAMITRDEDNNPTLSEFEKMPSSGSTSGRFVGLFRSVAAMVN